MEKKLIVMPSNRMDENKKAGREENSLLRMSKAVRENLGIEDKCVDIDGNNIILNLNSFKAYAEDVKKASNLDVDQTRVCFITTSNFKKLTKGEKPFIEVDASDTFCKLLIGTDPELLLMKDGKVIHAHNVLSTNKTAKFGADGAMAELRPDPAYSAEDLVLNIRKILQAEADKIKNIDLISTCYFDTPDRDYPVGTHIHIDNPTRVKKLDEHNKTRLFAVTNKILDELLTLPLIRLDGKDGHNRRARCRMSAHNGYNNTTYGKGYGFFGEWRTANGRLEHRSLSGLVLARPDICKAVFGTAKAIAEATYKNALLANLDKNFILPEKFTDKGIYNKDFKNWEEIPLAASLGCVAPSAVVANLMDNSSRDEITLNYVKNWLKKIRALSTYPKYADDVEALGDILTSSIKVLDGIDKNIKNNWKE